MIRGIASPRFLEMRSMETAHRWQRDRIRMGWNYAQAAAANGISVREWAMLECGVTPEDLRDGLYAKHAGAKEPRHLTPGS